MADSVVVAICTAHVSAGMQILEGQLWAADHPLVLARPDLFDTDLLKFAVQAPPPPKAPIEIATAEPGERRTTRGRATAAAQAAADAAEESDVTQ